MLFPIVGGTQNNVYTYKGKTYTLPPHGFLRDILMTLVEKTEDTVWYSFESNEETKSNYPFTFEVKLGYILKEKSVEVCWEVINKDSEAMFFSIGAHPAFLAKTHDTLTIESRGVTKRYLLDEKGVHEGYEETISTVEITPDLFKNDALIYDNVDAITLHTKKRDIRVSFKDFDYVGIWTKYVDGEIAPFVCIEPWMGIADFVDFDGDFSDKKGIQRLNKNETVNYKYTISL